MTALTITSTNVVWASGPIAPDQIAGEVFSAGACVYLNTVTGKWQRAQCDGTVAEAGADNLGMALATSNADGARISIALPTAIVTVGTGTAGIAYTPGTTLGTYIPTADLVATNKVTLAALGIGSSQLLLCRVYNAGAIL